MFGEGVPLKDRRPCTASSPSAPSIRQVVALSTAPLLRGHEAFDSLEGPERSAFGEVQRLALKKKNTCDMGMGEN